MKLTRDKISEKYEERKSVFDLRIPKGYYEVILTGELSYPLTEYESIWSTSMMLKKDKNTDKFINNLLNIMKPIKNQTQLREQYNKLLDCLQEFEIQYCEKYELLPQEFSLYVVVEDKSTMLLHTDEYYPVTRPFNLYITYNDNGKHYSVS